MTLATGNWPRNGPSRVRADGGEEIAIAPGDVVNLDPGHDAWTVGDEPCVVLDTGIAGLRQTLLSRAQPTRTAILPFLASAKAVSPWSASASA